MTETSIPTPASSTPLDPLAFDFDNIPDNAESLVTEMPQSDALTLLNRMRSRYLNPEHVPTEQESRLGILLTRRIRATRQEGVRQKKSAKAEVAPLAGNLADLFGKS